MNEKDGKKEKERRKDEKERKKKERKGKKRTVRKNSQNQLDCLNDKITTTLPTLRNH